MEERWIQTKALYSLLEFEPFVLLTALLVLAWGFYKIFLPGVSQQRHQSLQMQFRGLIRHYVILSLAYGTYHLVKADLLPEHALMRILPYIALLSFIWGGIVFVRVSRLIVLQYLFLGSMRAGVPILIVNIYSLVLSLILALWGSSQIFSIQVGPLIATSAAFSIILGMAMQDTLGNLFAGISLQLDRVFEIGDWIEVVSPAQKAVGQVREITWRATTLIGWSEEVIVIPNRVVASSQISNYQNGEVPLVRSQVFRLPYDTEIEKVKSSLKKCVDGITEIRKFPEPDCFISEATESWLSFKLTYYIDSFGLQYMIGDKVVMNGWQSLQKLGIKRSARQTLHIDQQP